MLVSCRRMQNEEHHYACENRAGDGGDVDSKHGGHSRSRPSMEQSSGCDGLLAAYGMRMDSLITSSRRNLSPALVVVVVVFACPSAARLLVCCCLASHR